MAENTYQQLKNLEVYTEPTHILLTSPRTKLKTIFPINSTITEVVNLTSNVGCIVRSPFDLEPSPVEEDFNDIMNAIDNHTSGRIVLVYQPDDECPEP
jgi:hypothetical protein